MKPAESNPFHELFARRWAVPVLAEMQETGGVKLVTLTRRLQAPRASVHASLDLLKSLGLVLHNPGHGHPMRPEYVLSERGHIVAAPSVTLIRTLNRLHALDCALKRWSMPTLHAIGLGHDRFSTIARHLNQPTDRAISLAIHDIESSGLISRSIESARPPRSRYRISRAANRLLPALCDVEHRVHAV